MFTSILPVFFFYPFRPKLRHVFRNTMSWRNFSGPQMRRSNFSAHSLMLPRKRWKKPRQTSEIGKMNFVRKSLNCVNWQKNEMTSMLAFRNYIKGKHLIEIAIIFVCVHTCFMLLKFWVVLVLACSAQHDYEAERRAREEKIGNLQEQANALKAQQTTTEHDLENFRAAVTKHKGEERQMQYVSSTSQMYFLKRIHWERKHWFLWEQFKGSVDDIDDATIIFAQVVVNMLTVVLFYRMDVNSMKSHEDKRKKQLNDLLSAKNDRLARFGPYMPTLLQHIEERYRRGEFHQKPRGPLGETWHASAVIVITTQQCIKYIINNW